MDHLSRVTPENITELKDNECLLFGANESGFHGGGAALFANRSLGARMYQGFGYTSKNTFAIPTKDWSIKTLPLECIEFYVKRFIELSKVDYGTIFLVTKIGCGLAGFTPEDIAPMFKEVINQENVYLPIEFWEVLLKEN